ncbi:nucleotidyltransferase family protein [Stenotrophomonas sp. MMGLT7]|uniref:nucleotidyltransferase family protein n=1 Tax=Stenotrophomonas sp. MMGLT7 TaxID=2901227 RepID=UPI001E58A0F4|nr:nucleotidyltransferase family protein [Stenotrophomonas sp. MMGLT7]MCD7097549.1 nucleotidyltransferase family protein [Stenotrophomonas sp. MMGLT7]
MPTAPSSCSLHRRLVGIARGNAAFMQALRHVRGLGIADGCIGAGAVRNLVWDHLHGLERPRPESDVDVAWFDASDLSRAHDQALQRRLAAAAPHLPWEVTNQAAVHLWFEHHFGHAVEPLRSIEDAVASWPEYATCVALSLRNDDTLHVIAPHGLDDLFGMVVRRNPRRVSIATYRRRLAEKRYLDRWPQVTVIE